MRRLTVLVIATCGVLTVGPATALARHHHHHARHHARVRTEKFGTLSSQQSQPSQPSQPSSPQSAGTVASFTGGVLTIMLADKSTISGTVTNDTEIDCGQMGNDLARDGGPSGSGGDNQGTGDNGDNQSAGNGDDQGDGGDQQGDDNEGQNQQTCMSALTVGATVNAAELTISGAGSVWTQIELG